MTLMSIAIIIPHPETVSIGGMFANLLPVTIGNIIGGAVFVGGAYWYNISEKTQAVVKSFKRSITDYFVNNFAFYGDYTDYGKETS